MDTRSEVRSLLLRLLALGIEAQETRSGLGLIAADGESTLHVTLQEESNEGRAAVRRQVSGAPGQYYQFDLALRLGASPDVEGQSFDTLEAVAAELVDYLRGKEPPGPH